MCLKSSGVATRCDHVLQQTGSQIPDISLSSSGLHPLVVLMRMPSKAHIHEHLVYIWRKCLERIIHLSSIYMYLYLYLSSMSMYLPSLFIHSFGGSAFVLSFLPFLFVKGLQPLAQDEQGQSRLLPSLVCINQCVYTFRRAVIITKNPWTHCLLIFVCSFRRTWQRGGV